MQRQWETSSSSNRWRGAVWRNDGGPIRTTLYGRLLTTARRAEMRAPHVAPDGSRGRFQVAAVRSRLQ